jgi:predicted kinase
MLIVIGGLPGTGKTSLSRGLAQRLSAVHVRIDTIEQAIVDSGVITESVGPAGYVVGYAVAADNLRSGLTVIADSVNPVAITRNAWRAAAERVGVPVVEVEVICSNLVEHQRRIESRVSDIPGLKAPTWQEVIDRHYEAWDRERIVIDTFGRTVPDSVTELQQLLLVRMPSGATR